MNMLTDFQFVFPELILLAFATFAFLGSAFCREKASMAVGPLLSVIIAAAFLPWSLQSGSMAFGGMLVNDGYSVFFRTIIIGMAGLLVLFAMGYRGIEESDRGEFNFFILSLTASMMLAVSSVNLIMIYLTLEAVSIISYILAGCMKRDVFSSESGIKYFLYGVLSTGVTLYGVSLLYGFFGTMDLAAMAATLVKGTVPLPHVLFALMLVLTGFAFKCSLVPFHMWTPDVYEGAPTPAAAFFSVAPKAMGFAVLLRIFLQFFGPLSGLWSSSAIVLAILTMTIGNVMALQQNNLKRLLAYSTIAHAGYILAGLALAVPEGTKATLFYLLVYGIMNLGAFGVLLVVGKEKKSLIEHFEGLYSRDPLAALAMTICLLSLAGIPPLAGFLAKFFIIGVAVKTKMLSLAVVLVLNSIVAMFYYLRVVKAIFVHEGVKETEAPELLALPRIAMLVVLCCNILLGIWPTPVLDWMTLIIK